MNTTHPFAAFARAYAARMNQSLSMSRHSDSPLPLRQALGVHADAIEAGARAMEEASEPPPLAAVTAQPVFCCSVGGVTPYCGHGVGCPCANCGTRWEDHHEVAGALFCPVASPPREAAPVATAWLARDGDGGLYLYDVRPEYDTDNRWKPADGGDLCYIEGLGKLTKALLPGPGGPSAIVEVEIRAKVKE